MGDGPKTRLLQTDDRSMEIVPRPIAYTAVMFAPSLTFILSNLSQKKRLELN